MTFVQISNGDKDKHLSSLKTPLTMKSTKVCHDDRLAGRHNHTISKRSAHSGFPRTTSLGAENPINQVKQEKAEKGEESVVDSIKSGAVSTTTRFEIPTPSSPPEKFDFDLILIGSCFSAPSVTTALKARELGKRVALVRLSSDADSKTGVDQLEGRLWRNEETERTAKLLVHHAAITGSFIGVKTAFAFGWTGKDEKPILDVQHDWSALLGRIQEYLGSENEIQVMQWQAQNALFPAAWYTILDENTVEFGLLSDNETETRKLTGSIILLDTVEEAIYPPGHLAQVPGKECCVTFLQMLYRGITPKKALVVGSDAEAVETAGMLASLRCDVTLCTLEKCKFLSGFDKDMVTIIRKTLVEHEQDIKILDCWKILDIRLLDGEALHPEYEVTFDSNDDIGDTTTGIFNCIIVNSRDFSNMTQLSVGKQESGVFELKVDGARTENLSDSAKFSETIWKAVFPEDNIRRSQFQSQVMLFSNYEYAWAGYTEENAAAEFGSENLKVFDAFAPTSEWAISHNMRSIASAKIICVKEPRGEIIGLHVIAPNARDVIQGYALAMQHGATKASLDSMKSIPGTCEFLLKTSENLKE